MSYNENSTSKYLSYKTACSSNYCNELLQCNKKVSNKISSSSNKVYTEEVNNYINEKQYNSNNTFRDSLLSIDSFSSKFNLSYSSKCIFNKMKKLHKARLLMFIATMCFAISGIIIKLLNSSFSSKPLSYNLTLIKSLSILLFTYVYLYLNKMKIPELYGNSLIGNRFNSINSNFSCNNIDKNKKNATFVNLDTSNDDLISNNSNIITFKKSKKYKFFFSSKYFKFRWIIINSISFICFFLFFPLLTKYFNLGIAIAILMINPILQNILSHLLLKEKAKLSYYILCILSLGIVLLIASQLKYNNNSNIKEQIDYINIMLGLCFALFTILSYSMIGICAKVLNTYYNSYSLNYLTSFYSSIMAIFLCFFLNYNYIYLFTYINFLLPSLFISMLSFIGIIAFNNAVKNADIIKISYINYLQLPVSVVFDIIFMDSNCTIISLMGITIIALLSLYSTAFMK